MRDWLQDWIDGKNPIKPFLYGLPLAIEQDPCWYSSA